MRCSRNATGHARTASLLEPFRTANSILLICARRNSVSPVHAVAHQAWHILGALKDSKVIAAGVLTREHRGEAPKALNLGSSWQLSSSFMKRDVLPESVEANLLCVHACWNAMEPCSRILLLTPVPAHVSVVDGMQLKHHSLAVQRPLAI